MNTTADAKSETPVLSTYQTFLKKPEIKNVDCWLKDCLSGETRPASYHDLFQILFLLDHLHVPLTTTIANRCKPLWSVFVTQYNSDWSYLLEQKFYDRVSQKYRCVPFQDQLIITKTLSELVSNAVAKNKTTCDITGCLCQTTSTEPRHTLETFFTQK